MGEGDIEHGHELSGVRRGAAWNGAHRSTGRNGVGEVGALTKDSEFQSEIEAVLCPEGNGEPLKGFKEKNNLIRFTL